MGRSTPEQFAKKLAEFSRDVKNQDKKAIEARADVTQRIILRTATTESKLARRYAVPARWVRTRILDGELAEVRLRTGFGFLAEKGSYKHPQGYIEKPKQITARRRRSAAAKGIALNESGLLSTPYGPRPYVKHPPQRAHPFWQVGIERSRKPGTAAYRKVVRDSLSRTFR